MSNDRNNKASADTHLSQWNPPWPGERPYLTKLFQPLPQKEELVGASYFLPKIGFKTEVCKTLVFPS